MAAKLSFWKISGPSWITEIDFLTSTVGLKQHSVKRAAKISSVFGNDPPKIYQWKSLLKNEENKLSKTLIGWKIIGKLVTITPPRPIFRQWKMRQSPACSKSLVSNETSIKIPTFEDKLRFCTWLFPMVFGQVEKGWIAVQQSSHLEGVAAGLATNSPGGWMDGWMDGGLGGRESLKYTFGFLIHWWKGGLDGWKPCQKWSFSCGHNTCHQNSGGWTLQLKCRFWKDFFGPKSFVVPSPCQAHTVSPNSHHMSVLWRPTKPNCYHILQTVKKLIWT